MPNVVFDASSIVGATIKAGSVPERALRLALTHETLCLSQAVEDEIRAVLNRPKFARYFSAARCEFMLSRLVTASLVVDPVARVTDCRDAKDTDDEIIELEDPWT